VLIHAVVELELFAKLGITAQSANVHQEQLAILYPAAHVIIFSVIILSYT
jgi:hypothetical protein